MDDFSLEKLAKEIVVARFTGVSDAPAAAGAVARQIVVKAVAGTSARQEPRVSVAAACRGVMSGMLILGKDLPSASVAILAQMNAAAAATHQDPADLMTWAMEGIAPVAKLAGRDACERIEAAVEASFMGAGSAFAAICGTTSAS